MADPSTPEDVAVTFHVKNSRGDKYTFTLPLSTTALDLKTKLATPEYANLPVSSQRLIYSGKVLKDGDTLAQHNVKEGNSMHLVKSAASNQRQNPASQSSPSASGTPSSNPSVAGVPQNLASGTGNDPLAGLTGARYAGFTQLPSADLFQNPPTQEDVLRQLQDPNFAQMMREAMNNPAFIDMMINSNPQLRSMGPQARQILQSEQFRRMMTNPDSIRQMMQLQQMFGGGGGLGGLGGLGGGQADAFPAPGPTTTTDPQSPQTTRADQQQQQQQQQQQPPLNPFAALGGAGANPFGSLFAFPPPSTDQNQGTDNAGGASNPIPSANQQANPFAALFNPAAFGVPPQQQQQNNAGTTTNDGGSNNANNANNSAAQNPFAANPLLTSSPFLQNPQQLQQMLQNLGLGDNRTGNLNGVQPNWLELLGNPLATAPDNRPPEERYATQLRQLNEMGFHDFDRNIQALSRSGGDVNGALEWLFSQT